MRLLHLYNWLASAVAALLVSTAPFLASCGGGEPPNTAALGGMSGPPVGSGCRQWWVSSAYWNHGARFGWASLLRLRHPAHHGQQVPEDLEQAAALCFAHHRCPFHNRATRSRMAEPAHLGRLGREQCCLRHQRSGQAESQYTRGEFPKHGVGSAPPQDFGQVA